MLTDELILKLITEEKIITEHPRKEFKPEHQHIRNDFQLTSSDSVRKFSVFMRQHINFQENFSIGLVYHMEDGTSLNIFRCNGNHGEVVFDILNPIPHFGYHIHRVTSELLENNINDPRHSELTKGHL